MPKRRKARTPVNAELLDVASAALTYGPTEKAIRTLAERRHIPAVKLGGRIYFRRSTLDRFFATKEREWLEGRGLKD